MTSEEMGMLIRGKKVLCRPYGLEYIVMDNHDIYVTVVRHEIITDPYNWLVRVNGKFVAIKDLDSLRLGDILRARGGRSGKNYYVLRIYDDYVFAVSTMDIEDPTEWEIVK